MKVFSMDRIYFKKELKPQRKQRRKEEHSNDPNDASHLQTRETTQVSWELWRWWTLSQLPRAHFVALGSLQRMPLLWPSGDDARADLSARQHKTEVAD